MSEQGRSISPGTHARHNASTWDGSAQPYNLFIPSAHGAEPPCPLVVVLHGITASWQTWFEVTSVCDWAESEGFVVAAPHGRGDWFYLGPGERDVLDVIEDVQRLCRIDADRVFLMGHSMGGWGTWHTACAHPDLFAAIVPMAGWAPLDLLPNLLHVPALVIHGADDVPIPAAESRRAVARLEELGAPHRHIDLPGRGHESTVISEMFPQIGDWLRDKRRSGSPSRVMARAQTPSRGRVHWVSILETGHFPHTAGIDAAVEGDVIRARTNSVRRFAIDPWATPLPRGDGLRVEIDHHLHDVPPLDCDQVLGFRRVHRSWMMTPMARDQSSAPPSPVVGRLDSSPADLPRRIAEIVATGTASDVALLPPDCVAPDLPPGEITTDTLLDIFLQGEDDLFQGTLTAGALRAFLSSGERLPFWWGDLVTGPEIPDGDADRSVLAAVPELMLSAGLEGFRPCRVSVRELVHRHVLATGRL